MYFKLKSFWTSLSFIKLGDDELNNSNSYNLQTTFNWRWKNEIEIFMIMIMIMNSDYISLPLSTWMKIKKKKIKKNKIKKSINE